MKRELLKMTLTVRRSWRERWLTWPWHPFTYTKRETFETLPCVARPVRRAPSAAPAYARRYSWQPPARATEEMSSEER